MTPWVKELLSAPGLDPKREVYRCTFASVEAGYSVRLTVDLVNAYTKDIKQRWGRQTEVYARASTRPNYLWDITFYMEKDRGLNAEKCLALFKVKLDE